MTATFNESEILSFYDLSKKEQEEILSWNDCPESDSFVECWFSYSIDGGKVKGTRKKILSLNNFMKFDMELTCFPFDIKINPNQKPITEYFHGIFHDSAFSGYAIKINDSGDGAIVAYFYA